MIKINGAEYQEQMASIQKEIDEREASYKSVHIGKFKYIVLLIAFLAFFASSSYLTPLIGKTPVVYIGYGFIAIFAILLICNLIKYTRQKSKLLHNIQALNSDKRKANFVLQKINDTILKIEKQLALDEKAEFAILQNEFYTGFNTDELTEIFNLSYFDIVQAISTQENITSEAKLKLESLHLKEKTINLNIDKLNACENDLQECFKQKQELLHLKNSILIAKDALEIAYKKIKENVTPHLRENLNRFCTSMYGDTYKSIYFNEDTGLNAELDNGRIVPIDALSGGTIDQMYLALRLNILFDTINEKFPIILDEPFAYYDDNRLANTLLYLNREYVNNQIFIFSCSNRECDVLNGLGIDFNLISL